MTERWVTMVEKFAEQERYCIGSDILYREDVVKLLARQHRAFVRMVKQERRKWRDSDTLDGFVAQLLAALAKQGKGGK